MQLGPRCKRFIERHESLGRRNDELPGAVSVVDAWARLSWNSGSAATHRPRCQRRHVRQDGPREEAPAACLVRHVTVHVGHPWISVANISGMPRDSMPPPYCRARQLRRLAPLFHSGRFRNRRVRLRRVVATTPIVAGREAGRKAIYPILSDGSRTASGCETCHRLRRNRRPARDRWCAAGRRRHGQPRRPGRRQHPPRPVGRNGSHRARRRLRREADR